MLIDFFDGLIDGVVDFLWVGLVDDVERWYGVFLVRVGSFGFLGLCEWLLMY